MKIGMNMLLWTPYVTPEYFPHFAQVREIGFDGVEIPVFGVDVEHYRQVGQAIADEQLGCTVVSIIPDEAHNPISPEASHRQGALDYLRGIIDCCQALAAEVLCGPLYQPLGQFTGAGPTESEKARAAEVLRAAAEHAAQANVVMAIEPLNRFECYFLNTLADAATLARRVNHPNLGVMYDTFHGNIEEKDPVGCIAEAGDLLRHVHVSANDRGTPGKGSIPWAGIFRALRRSGYDGWMTIEAFGRTMPDLAATTKIWRDISAGPEEVCEVGYRTIRSGWDSAA